MHERATVWLHLEGKDRPGVVIEVRELLVRVAYGTSREHGSAKAIVVHATTSAGKKFPLRETTYFLGANTTWEKPSALTRGAAECRRELFDAIRLLVEEYDAWVADEP